MPPPSITILCDTREPDWSEHPWSRFMPENVTAERATLKTGDFDRWQ